MSITSIEHLRYAKEYEKTGRGGDKKENYFH
jgi:hypothetical protein